MEKNAASILTAIYPESVTLNLFQGPLRGYTPLVKAEKNPCVYILASQPHGSLYIGVTSDLLKRLYQHRNAVMPGHTSKYAIYRLVHFEMFGDMERAIAREKQLKNWHRPWKINLICAENPEWVDLAVGLGLPSIAKGRRTSRP